MIKVYLHGANCIKLQGHSLNEQWSSISLHPNGWTVTLNFPRFPLAMREGLRIDEIFPTIEEELQDHYFQEEINKGEIRSYLDLIWKHFGKQD